jgi:hypothetical protein
VGHQSITAVLSAACVALALGACSSLPDDPGPTASDFVDEVEPTAVSVSPTPPQAGVPVSGCPTATEVLTALDAAGAVDPERPGIAVDGPPTCVSGWTAATVTARDGDPLSAVLQTRNGRLYVVVAGSALCDDPDLGDAPPRIRAAVGC